MTRPSSNGIARSWRRWSTRVGASILRELRGDVDRIDELEMRDGGLRPCRWVLEPGEGLELLGARLGQEQVGQQP